MDVVELGNLRDATIGMPGVSGLSVEQRKRLTIAVSSLHMHLSIHPAVLVGLDQAGCHGTACQGCHARASSQGRTGRLD